MAAFWEQTPRETCAAIEAAMWRDERRQKQDVALAWRTAALSRQKRLPSLKHLLAAKPAKRLQGKELKKRHAEFREMSQAASGLLAQLNKRDE